MFTVDRFNQEPATATDYLGVQLVGGRCVRNALAVYRIEYRGNNAEFTGTRRARTTTEALMKRTRGYAGGGLIDSLPGTGWQGPKSEALKAQSQVDSFNQEQRWRSGHRLTGSQQDRLRQERSALSGRVQGVADRLAPSFSSGRACAVAVLSADDTGVVLVEQTRDRQDGKRTDSDVLMRDNLAIKIEGGNGFVRGYVGYSAGWDTAGTYSSRTGGADSCSGDLWGALNYSPVSSNSETYSDPAPPNIGSAVMIASTGEQIVLDHEAWHSLLVTAQGVQVGGPRMRATYGGRLVYDEEPTGPLILPDGLEAEMLIAAPGGGFQWAPVVGGI